MELVPKITVLGQGGSLRRLEWSSTARSEGDWQVLTNIAVGSDNVTVLDLAVGSAARFYRVVTLQQSQASPVMALIPAGSFQMGDTFNEGGAFAGYSRPVNRWRSVRVQRSARTACPVEVTPAASPSGRCRIPVAPPITQQTQSWRTVPGLVGAWAQEKWQPPQISTPENSRAFNRLMARMRAARCSNSLASPSRLVARYRTAKFSRLVATEGWSGPRAFSQIASELL